MVIVQSSSLNFHVYFFYFNSKLQNEIFLKKKHRNCILQSRNSPLWRVYYTSYCTQFDLNSQLTTKILIKNINFIVLCFTHILSPIYKHKRFQLELQCKGITKCSLNGYVQLIFKNVMSQFRCIKLLISD